MPILRGVLGKVPSGPKARVRNFVANKELGTKSDIHENVISPGVIVPWHFHETEEVIVVLEGNGECRTETGTETYAGGDIIILPPRVKHSWKIPAIPSYARFASFQMTQRRPFWRTTTRARQSICSIQASGQNQTNSDPPQSA
jgi:quercetin dioxygenase-like cupin family protein